MSLQASFSGPLYQQVHESLKSKITTGEWKGGMVIPGDAELSRQLGVSIGTVRKALDELARQHLVVRERGRGTFIKEPSSWCGDLDTWLCDDAGRPIDADIEVVTAQTLPASAVEQKGFQTNAPRGIPLRVHKLLRIWRHDGVIICAERMLVDATRLPGLIEDVDLTIPGPSVEYMRKRRRGAGRTVWSLRVSHPDKSLIEHFDANGGDNGPGRIACRRVLHDASDVPVEICEQIVALGDKVLRVNS